MFSTVFEPFKAGILVVLNTDYCQTYNNTGLKS